MSALRRWLELRRRPILFASVAVIVVSAALAFRLHAVADWHAPAGDGLQYYSLSQSLIGQRKLAFGPGRPPHYSRLPGYPLFLAAVVHDWPMALPAHLWKATRANALLDVGTALLVFLLLRRRGFPLGAAVAGFVAVVVCPMLLFLSCYGLSESLATFLTTLTIFCALGERRWWMLAAGVAYALLQLTRVDGVAMLPPVALAIALGAARWRERILRDALFAVAAVVVFAPWPIRNYRQFGALHVEGAAWMRQDGEPLPLGMMHWTRSWATGGWGEAFPMLRVAYNAELDPKKPGILMPTMYDSDAEKALVADLFERYSSQGLTRDIDRDFYRLARERRRRSWLRYWVTLPLHRLVAEWTPMPEWELPVRSPFLHLPHLRGAYDLFERILFVLAVVGAWVAWRRDARLVGVLVVVVATRAFLHPFVHPFPVERYMVESFPAMMALAGCGIAALLRWRIPARQRA